MMRNAQDPFLFLCEGHNLFIGRASRNIANIQNIVPLQL